MVFFTSILIVSILYYLQADGLIYVTIIAVVAELANMFMTQTLTKSVEKKLNTQWGKKAGDFKKQLEAKEKTIKEFEKVQETSIQKLYEANKKIKAYEEKLGITDAESGEQPSQSSQPSVTPKKETPKPEEKKYDRYSDLPCGSDGIKRRT
ncbi:MAG: hypothetical protein KKE62_08695 [Proteobacteria bacterium]|nr:hypothetical protein [Pseudomonadota bacterium]MBU1386218.1 hypothetical protein [Pseudomonadota bacterium]MBU1542911.1 hypothetical protein [Pseudomonadota bacterium]MBU2479887.1 hypothetical protein [Pseudomonadota bacterium]